MKKSIIILEDESIISLMLKNYLIGQGYNIIGIVKDGNSAIELTKKSSPDILVMDVFVSGPMNGFEAYEQIREFCDVPAIFLTGNSIEVALEKSSLRDIKVLEKPVALVDLKRSLEELLD